MYMLMLIGISIDMFIVIHFDMFIDVSIDMLIDISFDMFIDMCIDILTDKEGGREEGRNGLLLKSNTPIPEGGEKL